MQFDAAAPGMHPTLVHPPYKSTLKRGPLQANLRIGDLAATTGALAVHSGLILPKDTDLTIHGAAAPLGEKIVVTGRVLDEDGRPVRNGLLEVWQCNAAGRYWHKKDQHNAPRDPNFYGFGKMLTDDDGRYRFITIKPGPYPWGNHDKAWRPAHIHFSLFGNVYAQRLVSRFSLEHTVGDQMLGYEFDIVLRGRAATPLNL